eukprot:Colp12_sorted_trinity150504_noHs@23617
MILVHGFLLLRGRRVEDRDEILARLVSDDVDNEPLGLHEERGHGGLVIMNVDVVLGHKLERNFVVVGIDLCWDIVHGTFVVQLGDSTKLGDDLAERVLFREAEIVDVLEEKLVRGVDFTGRNVDDRPCDLGGLCVLVDVELVLRLGDVGGLHEELSEDLKGFFDEGVHRRHVRVLAAESLVRRHVLQNLCNFTEVTTLDGRDDVLGVQLNDIESIGGDNGGVHVTVVHQVAHDLDDLVLRDVRELLGENGAQLLGDVTDAVRELLQRCNDRIPVLGRPLGHDLETLIEHLAHGLVAQGLLCGDVIR